jgi:hypothetical protein
MVVFATDRFHRESCNKVILPFHGGLCSALPRHIERRYRGPLCSKYCLSPSDRSPSSYLYQSSNLKPDPPVGPTQWTDQLPTSLTPPVHSTSLDPPPTHPVTQWTDQSSNVATHQWDPPVGLHQWTPPVGPTSFHTQSTHQSTHQSTPPVDPPVLPADPPATYSSRLHQSTPPVLFHQSTQFAP